MSSRSGTPNSTSTIQSLPPSHGKRKRKQVARACESCRVHCLKCDDHFPCGNCTKRGARCNNNAASKLSTLPQAHREIEALRQKVEALELELKATKYATQNKESLHNGAAKTAHNSDIVGCGAQSLEGVTLLGSKITKSRNGIHIRTALSPQTTWFGPSSLFYFIGCVSKFLSKSLQIPHVAAQMLPDSASKKLYAPAAPIEESNGIFSLAHMAENPSSYVKTATSLSSTQEEYFLDLFWQTYHVIYPVLNEAEFKDHYNSLWTSGTSERRPSPLVEIVLALCLQYGMAMSLNANGNKENAGVDCDDATIAGRWYYLRCQALLANESETPTISTLQCHILSSIYLCCGSFINMADSACGLAVRTAYMIGLHLDPPTSVQDAERELRRRLWWTLYVLESKMSMKLGRPFLLHGSNSTCALPADQSRDIAVTGSSFVRLGENTTWLTFTQYNIKLLLVACAAHVALFANGASMSMQAESSEFIPDLTQVPEVLEFDTKVSSTWMNHLAVWVESVPSVLRTTRQHGGIPFSTDLTPLAIEKFAPLWVQRQRLLLELMYHNLSVNLQRPFVCCKLKSPAAEQSGHINQIVTKCAAHAVTLTHMMYQVLNETTILDGWHEAFQWQWNSAVTLVGFVLSQSEVDNEDATTQARHGIELAICVLEKFGKSFASAMSAAGIVKNLSKTLNTAPRRHKVECDWKNPQQQKTVDFLVGEEPETVQLCSDESTAEIDLDYLSGHEWVQDAAVGAASTFSFDEGEMAGFLEELGQVVNPMLAIEGYNSWAANPYPQYVDGLGAFPQESHCAAMQVDVLMGVQ
jgi:hypothetical protein